MRPPVPCPLARWLRVIIASGLCLCAPSVGAQPLLLGDDDDEAAPPAAAGASASPESERGASAGQPEEARTPAEGTPVAADAQGDDEPDEGLDGPVLLLEEFELPEERVVTVTRYEQTVGEAPAIVQIFRGDRFREWGIETVSDALRMAAGVYVRPTRTSQMTAIIRGSLTSDNNKFLLLVDGVPWRDGVYGWGWIDRYLTLANVAQIELIRGPGSAMYGSNAFAGVINVITLRGDDLQAVRAGASIGSFARREFWVNGGDVVSTPLGRLNVAAYARSFTEAGDGPPFSSQGVRRIGAKDPHQGNSGGFSLRLQGLTLKWDVVDYRHARIDGGVSSFRDIVALEPAMFNYSYLNNFVDARYDWELPLNLHLQSRLLFQTYVNNGSYVKCTLAEDVLSILPDMAGFEAGCVPDYKGRAQYEAVVEPIKDTRRLGLGLEAQHAWADRNRVVLGFEWESEQIREVVDAAYVGGTFVPNLEQYRIPHTPLAIDDVALYLQDTLRPFPTVGLGITLGARLGHHRIPKWNTSTSDFDVQTYNHFTPRVGLVYSVPDRWALKVLYGQAYRAPTARELLLESTAAWVGGEPTLEPEVISTTEAEITLWPLRWLSWSTSGYYNEVEGEIIEGDAEYERSQGYRVMGLDTELRARLKSLEALVNYSYTDAMDLSEDLPQYGVPKHMANALLTARLGQQLSATVVAHWVGVRPREEWHVEGRADGEAFTLLDARVRAGNLLGGKLALTLSASNLLGTRVQYLLAKERRAKPYHTTDYEMEGRAFMVHVDATF